MKHIINQLGLRERTVFGGRFIYSDPNTKKEIEFRWDGAAVTNNGEVVVIEEEACAISSLHIHGHLSRVVIMCKHGERIKKVVWVVNKSEYHSLKETVESWITFFEPTTDIGFPPMEYRTPQGDLLLN